MRRIWLAAGSLVTVLALGMGSYTAVNALAHEEVHAHDVVAASAVDEVIVRTVNGSVDIVGDPDATEITVDAEISHGLRPTEYSVETAGGRLVVDSSCQWFISFWCRVDLTVTMPTDIPIDVRNSNGSIDVSDIAAGVVAHSSNGSISLIGVGGDVHADTSNGSIQGHGLSGSEVTADSSNGRIELTFAAPPRTVVADTSNGSIEITLPDDDTAYAVDTDTSNGSTETTVRTDPTSDHRITADTSNGSISVFYPTS